MDRAKVPIPKVEDVTCWRGGKSVKGTLHLSAHHFIFRYALPKPEGEAATNAPEKHKEMWITYPMISYCVYRPSPPASHQPPTIRLRCRDFTFIAFNFLTDKEARAVFESIRACTCRLGSLDKLLAFSYHSVPREKKINGWALYDARKEFARQGIGPKNTDKGWRITEINKDYTYSPTYPAVLVVPSSISDNVLNYAKTYRSRARIPVLTYLHPINNASITRSSQPMVGVRGNRSAQDEKLVAAVWASSKPTRPTTKSAPATPRGSRSTSDLSDFVDRPSADSIGDSQAGDGTGKSSESDIKTVSDGTGSESGELPRVYGAQQMNLIVDARPTVNAYAMQAVGMGTENMDNYKGAVKEYFGIDNIHVMRKSLQDVIEAMRDSDFTSLPPDREKLAKSGWLKHIGLLVDGGVRIARQVGIFHSHVLIHCSDGWDRTSQLSSLAQLCLDPYYRTLDGFITLVEKDWLSFGHMFRHRTGHLSSEKWFEIENERIANDRASLNGTQTSGGGGNAFENALSKAQGFFKKNDKDSEDSDSDEPPYSGKKTSSLEDQKYATKVKETSPVFHQFLDATYQIMYQFPTRFEFNERFLRRLLYHVYACQYGTFLFDNEKERVEWRAKERTKSVWDYIYSKKEEFLNKDYDPEVDDHVQGKERIILPTKEKVRWWAEMFGRTDEEMNGPAVSGPPAPPMLGPEINLPPVVTGVESANHAAGVGSTRHPEPPQTSRVVQQGQEALSAGLARLGIGRGDRASPGPSRPRSPRSSKELMEVEMQ
ncbi:uncharacterized protein PV09_02706 [Verruconis gallopava]|uniref:Myotubularin phosphatase domain-containing protein n=1 Tax=Verruconis gallopava TaxID=253628 RepID=A0A0D2AI04_9PEZI|nr:uncharacterized protein PV09_02706 [Verruconis gallopava]KIW06230.1 hypothetical protein PV09_02706 [Verruconis gallopava]